MLKKIKHSFIAIVLSLTVSNALAQSEISNNNIMQEIEQILLFNDEEKLRLKPTHSSKKLKDDFIIGQEENFDEAENKFDIKLQKSNIVINADARTKERMAYNASLLGQYEVAVELYKQVLEQEPENNYAKLSLAIIYQRLSQLSQAKFLYQELLKHNPQNKEEIIANMLSIISKESPRDALYMASKLLTQNSNSDYLMVQIALIYSDLKNYNQAISYMKKAVEAKPERVDYKYNLAIIYDNSKNYEKALENYLSVIKSYKNDKKWESLPISQIELRIETLRNKL